MTKNILVTGANGFVGSHLLDHLLTTEPDSAIYGLRRVNADMRNVKHLSSDAVTWMTGDLTDPLAMEKIVAHVDPDEIYHLGALSWVTPSFNMPTVYMQTNAIGTINLLEACLHAFEPGMLPKLLVSCTPEEFGNVSSMLHEGSPVSPVNHYAASKVAQDAVCQSYHAIYQFPIVRTRAFNHEGPRRNQNGALASFAHQIAKIEAGNQKPVVEVGNLEARRNFTHVKDMVRAYRLAMQKGVPGELYLIGNQELHSIGECLNALLQLSPMGRQIEVKVTADRVRPTELPLLLGDCSKFHKLTGWDPEIAFDEMLKDILGYWRDQE